MLSQLLVRMNGAEVDFGLLGLSRGRTFKGTGRLYTRYPIVARALGLGLGRVRRASKGILHTNWEDDLYGRKENHAKPAATL